MFLVLRCVSFIIAKFTRDLVRASQCLDDYSMVVAPAISSAFFNLAIDDTRSLQGSVAHRASVPDVASAACVLRSRGQDTRSSHRLVLETEGHITRWAKTRNRPTEMRTLPRVD